jgi:hypothetical protein
MGMIIGRRFAGVCASLIVFIALVGCDQAGINDAARKKGIESKRDARKPEYDKNRVAIHTEISNLIAAEKGQEAFLR